LQEKARIKYTAGNFDLLEMIGKSDNSSPNHGEIVIREVKAIRHEGRKTKRGSCLPNR